VQESRLAKRRGDRLILRATLLAAAVGGMGSTCGCIHGSLATSTGPNGSGAWSEDRVQQAHAGEKVRYSFILVDPLLKRPVDPYGYADYLVAEVGDHRIQCEPDIGGRFRFEHTLDGVEAGERIKVTATTYRQYGQRDFMKVGGRWLKGDSPFDEPDRPFKSDSLTLEVYETRLEIPLVPDDAELDFESGKLELIRSDGSTVPVYIDRPGRPGFVVAGPDHLGRYLVTYRPAGSQINTAGETVARFTVFDVAGNAHSAEVTLPTP